MLDPATIDLLRYAHMLCFSVGLGAAVIADHAALNGLRARIDAGLVDQLHHLHALIWTALAGLWITGMALIFARTGFVIENISPKLWTKLFVVTVLTLNAILIGRLGLGTLRRHLGQGLADMGVKSVLSLSVLAGLSTASWLVALALGVLTVLRHSGWDVFIVRVPLVYGAAICAAISLSLVMASHARQTRAAIAET